MKALTCHTSGSLSLSADARFRGSIEFLAGRNGLSQPIAASKAGQDAVRSERRQLPPKASVIGTTVPDATDAPTTNAPVYSPVTVPTEAGKSRFTISGMTTLINAIAIPARATPPKKAGTPAGKDRTPEPTASNNSAASTTRSVPNRRDSIGATGPTIENVSSMAVMASPAADAERFRSCRTRPKTGDISAIAIRMLRAAATMTHSSYRRPESWDWPVAVRDVEACESTVTTPVRRYGWPTLGSHPQCVS